MIDAPNVIYLEHVYAHPPAKVWRALTDPERLARWFVPNDFQPVVGHRFHFDMGPWGQQPCEVTRVEPEAVVAYRFAVTSLDTTITWRLHPEGEGTRLSLTHEGFNLDTPMGRQAFEGMRPGWPGIMAAMERVLAD